MERNVDYKNNKPFTRLPNEILNETLISDFGKRERKVFDLILRLSYGCFNRNYCIVRKVDFEAVGVGSSKIKAVLESLIEKNIIFIEEDLNGLKITINEQVDLWLIKTNGDEEKLAKLVGKNLSKQKQNDCQNSNEILAETGKQNFDKAFNFAKKQCLKEKDKEILKKNIKENVANNNSINGIEKMRKYLVNKKSFNILKKRSINN